jgi:ornithine cyclodeaminase/alanine dehydrogenase-like protein (mu-crystallin family)
MAMLILSADDVHAALDMPSCIESMRGALLGLHRGEMSMPLRTLIRPPAGGPSAAGGAPSASGALLGLMPAHRGGEHPLFSLKEIVFAPRNSERGLDTHQGAVLLHDGVDGRLLAVVNASAITAIRTAAVSGLATTLLARRNARRVAILGSGVQGRSHAVAMRAVLPDAELRIYSLSLPHAEALARDARGVAARSIGEALDGADVVCTCTSAREPIVALSMLAKGAHVNAVGSSVKTARELASDVVAAASLFVDRRESTVNESGDYLRAVEERGIGPDHIRAEIGELLAKAHPGRKSDGELTLFKSLGLAVEDLAAAELAVTRARERGLGTELEF